jgi:GTP cyclohydrolase I
MALPFRLPSRAMSVDRAAAAEAIRAFLRAIGHDPGRGPSLGDTPKKVADAFADDLLSGEGVDLAALLGQGSLAIDAAATPGPRDQASCGGGVRVAC